MTSTKEEAENAIKLSLREWGIGLKKGDEHVAFHNKAVQVALSVWNMDFDTTEDHSASLNQGEMQPFPQSLAQAFRHVLDHELRGSKCYNDPVLYVDKINDEFPDVMGCPFFWSRYHQCYKKSDRFEPFKQSELDPMTRFVGYVVPTSIEMLDCFHNEGWINGMLFETIVAHHVIHSKTGPKTKCQNCHKTGTLRWNGGSDHSSSWKDMICTNCGSTYEIKSKTNEEAIDKAFIHNKVYGGSYRLYLKMLLEKKRNAKHYIVFVSRQYSWPEKGRAYYQVELAEIDYVLPKLRETSFLKRDRDHIPLSSYVKMKTQTRKKWLQIPAKKCNWDSIAKSTYKAHYPDVDWDNAEDVIEETLNNTEPLVPKWCPVTKDWIHGDNGDNDNGICNIEQGLGDLNIDDVSKKDEDKREEDKLDGFLIDEIPDCWEDLLDD